MRVRPLTLLAALLLLPLLVLGCPDPRPGIDDDDTGGGDDDDGADDDDSSATDDDDAVDDDDSGGTDDDDIADDDDSAPPSPCDEAHSRLTNIGCEFWAVDLDNAENWADTAAAGQFAVAVANAHDSLQAHVEVWLNNADQGQPVTASAIQSADIDAGELFVFDLPRRDVDGDNITDGIDDGPQTWLSSRAFRITSDVPVVVYQFNTIDQQFSNDASLLLPTHALGVQHHVLCYQPNVPFEDMGPLPSPRNRAYVTIVGAHEATEVTVTPTSPIAAGEGVSEVSPGVGIEAGTPRTFTIGPYDVLNLETMLQVLAIPPTEPIPDLTGTLVESSLPVAVFTGTDLSVVSAGTGDGGCCAEHLEEQVLPTRAMRQNFVVTRSAVRSTSTPEPDIYRILPGAGGASVFTSLPAPDDFFSLAAGEFRELSSTAGFIVQADQPIHVAQYLVQGGDVPSGQIGDNSMMYVMPAAQRRDSYTFTTGEGFSSNHVVVSMADGTTAQLDGTELSAAGCSGPASDGALDSVEYVAWTCDVVDGAHQVTADANVAIYVYGYYNAGSYAYPGGAGLE